MENVLLILTIFSYVFVVAAYSVKVRKYFLMPRNVRWEIYPVATEGGEKAKYGGSYFEDLEFWTKPRHKNTTAGVWELVKKYLTMWGYFRRVRSYWFAVYPWHMGFLLIVLFDGLILLDAILMKTINLDVSVGAANLGGQFLYYMTLVVGLVSFTLGCIGSIGLLIKRIFDEGLREYASPQNYFNYVFFLTMFATGWVAWIVDPTFAGLREFFVGVISLEGVEVSAAEYSHILLFALFLFYLPFTRSTHYITKIFAFFKIRWDDEPHFGSPDADQKLAEVLSWRISWSAPHIQTGQSWGETVTTIPVIENEGGKG